MHVDVVPGAVQSSGEKTNEWQVQRMDLLEKQNKTKKNVEARVGFSHTHEQCSF